MKTFIISAIFTFFSLASYSQKADSIAIYDKVTPSQGLVKNTTPPNVGILKDETLVIIDNKIYTMADKEFKQLDQSKVKSMNVVKDANSKTSIKAIIFITTM